MIFTTKILFCFHRWSAKGNYFGRLGEDSISIYETPVSCWFVINLTSFYLLLADFGFSLPIWFCGGMKNDALFNLGFDEVG